MKNTLEILKDLISIPSYVDGTVNEEKIREYVNNYFLSLNLGYKIAEQKVGGKRKNLIITNQKDPKIILFGHMDTVLPNQNSFEPFSPRKERNKIYGLGSVDMKAGLAIMLSLATKIKKDNLGFIFTVDEEYEFKGAVKLAKTYDFNPDIIINLEPTNLEILNGCRGITEFSFIVQGKSCHASRKSFGINAIEKAVKLTEKLQKEISLMDENRLENSLNLAYLNGGVLKEIKNNNYVISGFGMVVPDFAQVNCEIRIGNSKITEKYISEKIREIAKSLKVSIGSLKFKFYLGSMLTPKEKLIKFEESLKEIGLPIKYRDINMSGFYEVQLLKEKFNCNCVVFGPGPNEQSHSADEYVNIETVINAEKTIEVFLNNNL